VAKATGARTQTTVNNLDINVLGTCASFEERQVGRGSGSPQAVLGFGWWPAGSSWAGGAGSIWAHPDAPPQSSAWP